MPAGFPVKANYVAGDVLTAANMNDLAGTLNFYDPTAKGDLFPATGVDAVARLAAGANNTILTADSSTATGLKWAAPATAASGLTFISTTAFTAQTTVSINSVFSSTYTNYLVVMDTINTGAVQADLSIRFRASGTDTTTGYNQQRLAATTTTVSAGADTLGTDEIYLGSVPQSGNPAFGTSFVLMSPNEAKRTTMQGSISYSRFTSGNQPFIDITCGSQSGTTQFDGITFIFGNSNTGTIYIYGLQKA